MAHLIEQATSGRAKCRGCGGAIAVGEWRFGERLPNPFAEGDALMTHWFHPACAAYRRPEAVLEALQNAGASVPDRDRLVQAAQLGVAHRRVPRVSTAERAASGRATCRSCREAIEKGAWRISLVFYEDGRFTASGFIHVRCAKAYFETTEILDRVRHFSPALGDQDIQEIGRELSAG